MRVWPLAPIVLSTLLLTACGTKTLTLMSFDGAEKTTITVEVADSPTEREHGMMNRTSLAKDSGMLFVFPNAEMLIFWMKNTMIPLEILFFDADGSFVNALEMQPCTLEPCDLYKSAARAQYALEVAPGYRDAHKIGTGWKLDLEEVQGMSKPK